MNKKQDPGDVLNKRTTVRYKFQAQASSAETPVFADPKGRKNLTRLHRIKMANPNQALNLH